jgi:hypothetical protein
MEDNGARSNPLETDKDLHLSRLVELKRVVDARSGKRQVVASRRSRRQGAVLAAVTSLLEIAEAPLRYVEVKAGIEALLGETVPGSTVREALAAHTTGPHACFRRVATGQYELTVPSAERAREVG